jgi:hypothetical protein
MWTKMSWKRTHCMSKDKFYHIYQWIIARCNVVTHRLFKNYWWRWIKCLRNSFEEFKNDMYNDYIEHDSKFWWRNTSIDRIDVNGNYCKDNCRRATLKEQNNNKTNSHIINWKTIKQRSDEYWIPKTKLRHRIVKMWLSLDEALNYERVNKSWVEWVIRSNRDNRRIVQNIIEWKIKRKFFKELDEAIAYKKNAIIPTK